MVLGTDIGSSEASPAIVIYPPSLSLARTLYLVGMVCDGHVSGDVMRDDMRQRVEHESYHQYHQLHTIS